MQKWHFLTLTVEVTNWLHLLHILFKQIYTPNTGRILNRLTKDLAAFDDSLPITLYDTLTVFLTAAGAMVILAIG